MFHERFKELGNKYLVRTREEFDVLQQAFARAQAGDAAAAVEVRNMAHRICGSGAMLGFMKISEVSAKIEAIMSTAEQVPANEDWPVVAILIQQLDIELQHAKQQTSTDI